MESVRIGIDIGQKRDPTAIAVVEREQRQAAEGSKAEEHFLTRHLERLELGTPYPLVAERLKEIIQNVRALWEKGQAQGSSPALLSGVPAKVALDVYLDATGVGQPVVDLLTAAGERVIPCYFTHGDRRTRERGQVSVGKASLVSRLQLLLQTGRLHLTATAEARQLAKELQDYEIRVDQDANDRYGAFKVGTHDDLVTALGLAVQPPRPRWGSV